MIRLCHQNAGLDPLEISYAEDHGTGNWTGNPIENVAIGEVVGKGCLVDKPLLVGSVKSNIGLLGTAFGLAAILKVAMAFENRLIPSN